MEDLNSSILREVPRQAPTVTCMLFTCLLAVSLLAGCALPRMIDSSVQSFIGSSPAPTQGTYRFERLPSQQQSTDMRDRIEVLAEEALDKIGLQRNDAEPQYLVQLSVGVQQIGPYVQPMSHVFIALGNGMWEHGLLWNNQPPWYRHSLHLVLRSLADNNVLYETQAVHEGPWSDNLNLLAPMLEAALRDYPNPPAGARQVVVELPAPRRTSP